MDKNQSLKLAAVVFGIVALAHLIRAVLRWPMVISSFNIPVYFSYVAFIVAGYLSWHMYNAGK